MLYNAITLNKSHYKSLPTIHGHQIKLNYNLEIFKLRVNELLYTQCGGGAPPLRHRPVGVSVGGALR